MHCSNPRDDRERWRGLDESQNGKIEKKGDEKTLPQKAMSWWSGKLGRSVEALKKE